MCLYEARPRILLEASGEETAMSVSSDTSTLANGAFGKVYKKWYNDQWAAVKKVPVHLLRKKDLEREYKVYKEAVHPNIVRILGPIVIEDNKYIIPLEFIFGEDLETTIFKRDKSRIQLTSAVRLTIVSGMCEGLYFLHSKDIVHQDLKPDNIMVEHGSNRAVIIDMGLAKFFKNGLNSAMDMGNMAYSAPEVLLQQCQRDQRSDVWAMGKTIAELRLLRRLRTGETCPQSIKELLRQTSYCRVVCSMVETDPEKRVTMAGVVMVIAECNGAGERVGMSCGHRLTPASLTRWCQRQLSEGRSRLRCGVCKTKWSLNEISEKSRLTNEEKANFESLLFKNYAINDLKTKFCPGCNSYVLRKDPQNLCVRCPLCTSDRGAAFDFCWQCLKSWRGPANRTDHCDNEGCANLAV